ncbi:MAG: hydrogenase maturation nickel metallochaperone HypA [Planctomycetaceae bacterium]|nr:hydrogenase maturation nickel metallochaperone HypA [Planctomycetaceae bacterium]
MHEGSIAQGVLDVAARALASRPAARRVTRINLVIGVLAGIDGECLRFYLQELSRDTPVFGAAVEIASRSATLTCRSCGAEQAYDGAGDFALHCSRCGGENELAGGDELYVESVEVEDEQDQGDRGDPQR